MIERERHNGGDAIQEGPRSIEAVCIN
jgi:hypothetical protein